MKNLTKTALNLVKPLAIASGFLGLTTLLLSPASFAQSQRVNPSDGYNSNERNSLGGSMGDGSFNPFDLIHNAKLGGLESMRDFSNRSNTNINYARDSFFRQRQESLQNYQPNLNNIETDSTSEIESEIEPDLQ